MNRHDLLVLTIKGFLAWLLLSGLVWYAGEGLLQILMPLLKPVILMMEPDLACSLKIAKNGFNPTIGLSAWTLRPVYLNASKFITPETTLTTSANLLHVLVPLVIEWTILLVWPVQRWSQRLLLLGLGFLTAILVVMAILPAQLLGKLEVSFQSVAQTGEQPRAVPWFVDWMIFCEMGGRWLLAIASAWLCIRVQRTFLLD